jgi:hypothetical protein
MASDDVLDRIARLGLFGKRYKDFESAPPDAQRVIRFLAGSSPELPPAEADPAQRADRAERALRTDERLRKLEAGMARLERGIAKIAEGLARLEQLDVVKVAAQLKIHQSTKIRAGQRKAQLMGKHCGRPPREFDREKARRLRANGASFGAIAKVLGVPKSTVVDALREGCTENLLQEWLN